MTAADADAGVREGDPFTSEMFHRFVAEEYDKLQRARNRDVHDDSKAATLPIAREIVETYVLRPFKLPWYVDLLNITLDVQDIDTARARIAHYVKAFAADGTRVTENLDFA
jgi:malate synthase